MDQEMDQSPGVQEESLFFCHCECWYTNHYYYHTIHHHFVAVVDFFLLGGARLERLERWTDKCDDGHDTSCYAHTTSHCTVQHTILYIPPTV